MNDYQQRRERSYVLPQAVYRQALYAVKDLGRLRAKLRFLEEDVMSLTGRDPAMVFTQASIVSDITGNRASEIASTFSRISAIENAFNKVPDKYRAGLEEKLIYDVPYSNLGYCLNTWKKWQQVLIFHVAVNLKLL
jgi:hypothetical protein